MAHTFSRDRRFPPVVRAIPLAALLLLTVTRAAPADAILLKWDDCSGAGGSRNKTFSCGTTSGTEVLVASFIPPGGLGQFEGLEAALEVQTAQATLPAWWQFQDPGACRPGSLVGSFEFDAYSGCENFWARRSAMGGTNYEGSFEGANRGRIRLVCAVPEGSGGPLNPSTEYYAFRLIINHARTVGGGACAGCLEPACISFTDLNLVQPAGLGDHTLTANGGNALVTWQGGTCASGTQTGTWGKLKSIYR